MDLVERSYGTDAVVAKEAARLHTMVWADLAALENQLKEEHSILPILAVVTFATDLPPSEVIADQTLHALAERYAAVLAKSVIMEAKAASSLE
jgi:hypothetical protein